MTGPSEDDLERLERGSIPSSIDVPEYPESVRLPPSTRHKIERARQSDPGVVTEMNLEHELAQRMLHNATADD